MAAMGACVLPVEFGGRRNLLCFVSGRVNGAALDQSADHVGAGRAAYRSVGPPQAVPEAIHVRPAGPYFNRVTTRGDFCGRRSVLPAPRHRLERGAEGGGSGSRTGAAGPWRVDHHAAASEKSVPDNKPLDLT